MAHGGEALSERPSAAALEAGRLLFAAECRFLFGAATADALPPPGSPEVAFAGRSNVGKSSLLNALTGRRALARVSREPGRTQQLNFFLLGGRLLLADLPGYGYARAGRARAEEWSRLAEAYLVARPTLRRVFLLIDARHGPMAADRALMALMDRAAVSYQVVLTKVDAVEAGALDERRRRLAAELGRHAAAHPEIHATSARDGAGIPLLRAALAALAGDEPLG